MINFEFIQVCIIINWLLCYILAQFSPSNVHKGGLKHHHSILCDIPFTWMLICLLNLPMRYHCNICKYVYRCLAKLIFAIISNCQVSRMSLKPDSKPELVLHGVQPVTQHTGSTQPHHPQMTGDHQETKQATVKVIMNHTNHTYAQHYFIYYSIQI